MMNQQQLFADTDISTVSPPQVPTTDDYEAFVAKFVRKRTTDDCYTPPEVYDVVVNYVSKRYGIAPECMIRPFWPDAPDYKQRVYGKNEVVVDNPPFSIFSKIVRHYKSTNVPFFLFAPHLTLGVTKATAVTMVITNTTIRYENGACVNTSFLTNLDPHNSIILAGDLAEDLKKVQNAGSKKKYTNIQYPANVITAARLGKYLTPGVVHVIPHTATAHCFNNYLLWPSDNMKMYGSGLLISDSVAAELERILADKRRLANEGLENEGLENVLSPQLTERAREILNTLHP